MHGDSAENPVWEPHLGQLGSMKGKGRVISSHEAAGSLHHLASSQLSSLLQPLLQQPAASGYDLSLSSIASQVTFFSELVC